MICGLEIRLFLFEKSPALMGLAISHDSLPSGLTLCISRSFGPFGVGVGIRWLSFISAVGDVLPA